MRAANRARSAFRRSYQREYQRRRREAYRGWKVEAAGELREGMTRALPLGDESALCP